jgi:tetratricopeptide (TPR) repeat protein
MIHLPPSVLIVLLMSPLAAADSGSRAWPVRLQEPAPPSPSPAAAPAAAVAVVRGDAVVIVPPEVDPPGTEPLWLGELISELLPRSLAMLGVPAVERDDRRRAQSALEIPLVPLTRATSIRVAEALGARRVVFGSYSVKDAVLTLRLQVLDLEHARAENPIVTSGFLRNVGDMVHAVAWELAGALGTAPVVSRDQFAARRPAASFEALQAFGQSFAARRPVQKARLLRQALSAAPQFHEARLTLARVQLDAGEFSAAQSTLTRVPASSHLARSARFMQGVAMLEIGRYHEAADLYANLAAERPTPSVLNNQALAALRDAHRKQRASDLLRHALDRAPDSADIAFNLGWALLLEGDPSAAEFFLRGVLRRDPLEGHARLVLSWALQKAGRAADAAQEWKGVLALAPNYQALSTPDTARRFERIMPSERMRPDERAERTNAEVAASLVGRADRRLATNDAEGALRDLTRAAYLDPYATRVHLLLARAYRTRGDRGRAESEFRMTLWSQDDPAVRAELAALLKEMGRGAEAKAEAEKVLKLDPDNETAKKVISGG